MFELKKSDKVRWCLLLTLLVHQNGLLNFVICFEMPTSQVLLQRPKRWKSLGARSRLCGGCCDHLSCIDREFNSRGKFLPPSRWLIKFLFEPLSYFLTSKLKIHFVKAYSVWIENNSKNIYKCKIIFLIYKNKMFHIKLML